MPNYICKIKCKNNIKIGVKQRIETFKFEISFLKPIEFCGLKIQLLGI